MVMYADDTTLFCKISDQVDEAVINTELSKIYNWFSSNKLSLNVAKTKFMFSNTCIGIILIPN